MKATFLLGTLKSSGLSNTQTLSEFLIDRMKGRGVEGELVRLVDYNIPPGTHSDMGPGDDWPKILEKILHADILVFASPVWWGGHSSMTQRVIERLDELHDKLMAGEASPLEGKVGGIVITGDSDGAQHIIGNVCNFFNALGVLVPPYATLSVLWEGQAKGARTSKAELLSKYESDYSKYADRMIDQMLRYVQPPAKG